MSNVPATIPAYAVSLFNAAAINDEFSAGLPQGTSFPRIGLSGKQFVKHIDGTSEVITGAFTDPAGNQVTVPLSSLKAVIVRGKASIDKTWYMEKYNPNAAETKSPDCFSRDGIKPDASSPMKQCENCAQCPHNQFGSGIDQNGNPTKGKACADTKMLAIYGAGGVFGFKIPSASLKNFNAYLTTLQGYGLTPPAVITNIAFDTAATYPILTFTYEGVLGEDQAQKIAAMRESQEVMDIIGGVPSAPPPAPQVVAPQPVLVQTPAPAPQPVVQADPLFAAPAPQPVVEKPKATRAAKTAATVTPISEAQVVVNLGQPSEDELRNSLGL